MNRFLTLLALTMVGLPAVATEYHVDHAASGPGDGLSWGTAWPTIAQATDHALQPGDRVLIAPGTYGEPLYIDTPGEPVVPVTAGVSVTGRHVYFPDGTDLSGIDLVQHPGEYYVYVYRSRLSNNGVFPVTGVYPAQSAVQIDARAFRDEQGEPGSLLALSATVGRPVVFRCAADDTTQRVVLDL
ncbi:hypothetical protein GF314_03840, partial [bacterium]|nr:hypothetical protein [bacterium]